MESDNKINYYLFHCISCSHWKGDREQANKIISKKNLYTTMYGECFEIYYKADLSQVKTYSCCGNPEFETVAPEVPHHFGCIYYSLNYNEILEVKDLQLI